MPPVVAHQLQWCLLLTAAVALPGASAAATAAETAAALAAGDAAAEAAAAAGASGSAGSSGSSGSSGGGVSAHHSIFELSIADIDSPVFWSCFTLMIVFTIIIDRLQARGNYWADRNAGNLMIWRRVNAELMMFGIVAISIFIFSNLVGTIPETTFLIVEFVDILCSCGCCALILIAGILLIMIRRMSQHYKEYEQAEDVGPGTSYKTMGVKELRVVKDQDQSESEPEETLLADKKSSTMNCCRVRNINKAEWQAMVFMWKDLHKVPHNFKYHDYLKRCLQCNVCNVMEISWPTWAMQLVVCLLGWFIRQQRKGAVDSNTYMLQMTCLNWASVFVHVGLVMYVYLAQSAFLVEARKALASGAKKVESSLTKDWSTNVRFIAQNLAFCNAFLMTMFFMHEWSNLKGYNWSWYVLLALPWLFNFVYALPFIVSSTAWMEAFLVLDPDSMEMLLEELQADERDMKFVRERWEALGKPKFDTDEGYSEEEMDELFTSLGFHISSSRNKRLFIILDKDDSGMVDAEELLLMLNDKQAFDSLRELQREASAA